MSEARPPQDHLAHFERAMTLYKGGRVDEAIAEFQAALKIDARHAPSHYNLALRLESKGRYAEAMAEFEAFLGCASKEELQHEAAVRARIAGLKSLLSQASSEAGKTLTIGPDGKPPGDATKTLGPAETKTLGPAGTMTLDDGGASTQSPLAWHPGDVIDGLYEVREVLGEGGFGSVHKVWHRGWRMELAVKAPLAEKVAKRSALESFVQEANTWVGLGLHPNVVTCYFVRVMGLPRIFIEYMAGGSLAGWIASGRTSDARVALDCAVQMARGMDYVHRRGLVHRDLKPGNCLMTEDGTLKVTDFGLVKVGAADEEEVAGAKLVKVKSATMGAGFGTPEYMAPEQWTDPAKTGQAADLWAFGAISYELLCGHRPFEMREGEPADAFHARVLSGDWTFEPPDGPLPEVSEMISRCLSVDPARRPAGFADLVRILETAYARMAGHAYPRPAPEEPPVLADTLVNQGVSMADLGRDEEALRLFGEALTLDPVHAGAMYDQGLVLIKKGQGDGNLIPRLAALRRAQTKDWVPAYLLGLAFHIKGRADEAKSSLVEAQKLGMPQAFSEMKFAGYFVAPPKGTERTQLEKESFRAHMERARELLSSGDAAEAYEEVKKARAVSGYERSEKALALARKVGTAGTKVGLAGGWQAVTFARSEGAVALGLSEDGKRVTSRHADGALRIWDARSGEVLKTGAEAAQSRTEARTADGRYVIRGREDGTVAVVELKSGREVMSTKGHSGAVKALVLAADGGTAYTAGEDGVRGWEFDWQYSFSSQTSADVPSKSTRRMRRRGGSIALRFLAWFLLLSVAPAGLVGWELRDAAGSAFKAEAFGDLQMQAKAIGDVVHDDIAALETDLADLSRSEGEAPIDIVGEERRLNRFMSQNPAFLEIAVLDMSGREILRSERFKDKIPPMRNFSGAELFSRALSQGAYVGGLSFTDGRFPTLMLAFPLYTPGTGRGGIRGVMLGKVSLGGLSGHLSKLASKGQYTQTAVVAVEPRGGIVVAHSDLSGTFRIDAQMPQEILDDIRLYGRRLGTGEFALKDGSRVFGAFTSVGGMDWVVYLWKSGEGFGQATASLWHRSLRILVWIGCLASLLAFFAASGISRLLREMRSSIDALAAGRFDSALPEVNSSDEMGGLAEAVRYMGEVLAARSTGRGSPPPALPPRRPLGRGRLAYKLSLWFLFISLTSLGLVGWDLIGASQEKLKSESLHSQEAVAVDFAETASSYVAMFRTVHASVARRDGFAALQPILQERELRRVMEYHPELLELSVIDATGQETVRVGRFLGAHPPLRNFADQMSFRVALESGEYAGGLNRFQGLYPTLTLADPIRDSEGGWSEKRGVLIGRVSLNGLSQRLRQMFPEDGPNQAAVVAGDVGESFLVAHSDPKEAFRTDARLPSEITKVILTQAAKNGGGEIDLEDSTRLLGAFADVEDTGWIVFVQRPIRSLFDATTQMRSRLLRAIPWVVAIAVLLSLVAAGDFLQPIRRLQAATECLTVGKLEEFPELPDRHDEFGDLGESFMRMRAALKERMPESL